MTKQALRHEYKKKRTALGIAIREKLHDLILIRFQQLGLEIPGTILSYAAMADELDPYRIMNYCRFKNPEVQECLPVINPADQSMQAVLVNEETTFMLNRYGIEEPVNGTPMASHTPHMVFVPLLAFDLNGNRVGYGKGYYDRFLANCKMDVVEIGFSFFEAVPVISDVGAHDISLDYCISPERIYDFKQILN